MKRRSTLVLLLLATIFGCNSSPKPSSLEDALDDEYNAEDTDSAEQRTPVRKAVDNYLKQHVPDWRVKGVSIAFYSKNVYLIGADVERSNENQTIYLMSRLFVSSTGETYWKVEDATSQKLELSTGKVLPRAQPPE